MLNPLQLVVTRKPYWKIFLTGQDSCLVKDNLPLVVFIEPVALKTILNTQEMLGLIEQLELYSAEEKKQAMASAAKQTLKMSSKEKLELVNNVLKVGSDILKSYTRLGGWLTAEQQAEFKNGTQLAEVYPLAFVDTIEEAQEQTNAVENLQAGDPDFGKAFLPLTFLREDELLEITAIIKDIASSLKNSDEPIIPIKTEEGGDDYISPKVVNDFPSTV